MELQNGDVACVMVLADERGREFIESADFEICFQEPSLIGRWVYLTYRMERVIAESCQGDPACAESELIPLVVAAKLLAEPGRSAASQTSHCTALESTVFACDAGSKSISVCASSSLANGSAYLEYRFGKLGDAPELTLPATRVPPAQAATGENVAFSGGGGAWLRFRNGATAYVVYGGIGRWGPDGATAEKQGVVVEREGRQIAHVPCTGPLDSALSSEWFAEAGVGVGADEEFLFP